MAAGGGAVSPADEIFSALTLALPGLLEQLGGDDVAAVQAFARAYTEQRRGSIRDTSAQVARDRAEVDALLAARELEGR